LRINIVWVKVKKIKGCKTAAGPIQCSSYSS